MVNLLASPGELQPHKRIEWIVSRFILALSVSSPPEWKYPVYSGARSAFSGTEHQNRLAALFERSWVDLRVYPPVRLPSVTWNRCIPAGVSHERFHGWRGLSGSGVVPRHGSGEDSTAALQQINRDNSSFPQVPHWSSSASGPVSVLFKDSFPSSTRTAYKSSFFPKCLARGLAENFLTCLECWNLSGALR